MGHRIEPHDERILRVAYFGNVGYRERCEAVAEAAARMEREGITRLIVDFGTAEVHDDTDGSRADFIASVITAPWPEHTRVAPLHGPPFAAQGGRIAGMSRGLQVRAFDSEAHAVAWLVAAD